MKERETEEEEEEEKEKGNGMAKNYLSFCLVINFEAEMGWRNSSMYCIHGGAFPLWHARTYELK